MDETEVAAVWFKHKRNAKMKVNRKMWAHPINNARLGKGTFHVLSVEIKSDPNKFFNYYRMSATSLEALLNSIESYTGCHRRKGPNFGRVFLMLNYTDITQNTYIQS